MTGFPPLSLLVWNGNLQEVAKLSDQANFSSPEEHADYINSPEIGNEAPIITALKLQRLDIVQILFQAGAKCYIKDRNGLSSIFWVLLYFRSDPLFFTGVLRRIEEEMDAEMEVKVKNLQRSLAAVPDFEAQMDMRFSTWLPLVKRFLPNDKYTVTKHGCSFRIDCTLAGFKRRSISFRRGKITLLLLSDPGSESMGDLKLVIIDHVGRRFARINKSDQHTLFGEDVKDETLFSLSNEEKLTCIHVAQECIASGEDPPVWDSRAGDLLVGTPIPADEESRMLQWAASAIACTSWPMVDVWSRDSVVRPVEQRSILSWMGIRPSRGPSTAQIGDFTGIQCEVENLKVMTTLVSRLFVKPPVTTEKKTKEEEDGDDEDLLGHMSTEEQAAFMAELDAVAAEVNGGAAGDPVAASGVSESVEGSIGRPSEARLPRPEDVMVVPVPVEQTGGSSTSEELLVPGHPKIAGLDLDTTMASEKVVSAGEEYTAFAKEFVVGDAPAPLQFHVECNVASYDIVVKVHIESLLLSGERDSCVLWSGKETEFSKSFTYTFAPGEHVLHVTLDNTYSRWTNKTVSTSLLVKGNYPIPKSEPAAVGQTYLPTDPLSHCVFRTISAIDYYGSAIPGLGSEFEVKPNNVFVSASKKRKRHFNVKAKVALADTFPFTLPQFLPVVEALARTNRHFDNFRRFLEQKIPFPDSFPVQIEIPILTQIGLKVALSFPNCRVLGPTQAVDPYVMSIPDGYVDATDDLHNDCFFERTPEK